jgi:hypothetical protein
MTRGKSDYTMFHKNMGNLENMQAIGDILSYISPIILIVTLKEHKKPTDPG